MRLLHMIMLVEEAKHRVHGVPDEVAELSRIVKVPDDVYVD